MIEERQTPDVGADVLAERRARRAQEDEAVAIRRTEAAEVAVRNLETHLASLEQRLGEVAQEREGIAQLKLRLDHTERQAGELAAELAQLRERDARLEPIVRELMDLAAELRSGYERELAAVREELQGQIVWERETYARELTAMSARMEDLRYELARTTSDVRAQLSADDDAAAAAPGPDAGEPQPEPEVVDSQEMAEALVRAVDRLRARVAEVKESEPEEGLETVDVSGPGALQPRTLTVPEARVSWLAPAIRRLAEKRDAKLAAELVVELLPAQHQIMDGSLEYDITIAELGAFHVALDGGHATVSRGKGAGPVDFSLEGSAAAFSELAAGGTSRKHPGLRVRKGRLRARRLLKARRRPVALADLVAAEIDIWPGLLLLAIAEAIDPSWTAGQRFDLAFDLQSAPSVEIFVQVADGAPIFVSRTTSGTPVARVSVTERALMCLLAGVPAPPEHTPVAHGDVSSVETFLGWVARAQGLQTLTA